MKKSVIRIISFLVILVLCLWYVNSIFRLKYGDGIYNVRKFYELEDNTVDVLVLGSSHAFVNISPGAIWDEQGVAVYDFCGSLQPMWNSYYYLKEALKTQTPKLVILEGYATTISEEYLDDSRIIKNTYGLKWSKNKIDAIKTSAPPERWDDFFIDYSQYHNRYKEINESDFLPNQGDPLYKDWKGFGCSLITQPVDYVDVSWVSEKKTLPNKSEEYYRKTIELAKENNIPIAIVVTPYAGITEDNQKIYNRAMEIAAEYDVPYRNYNLLVDEIGLDYSADIADYEHLNYKGSEKFSKYLANDLLTKFNLPDQRGDVKYDSWERSAQYTREMIYNQTLVDSADTNIIISMLNNPNYMCFVSIEGMDSSINESVLAHLANIGITEPKNGTVYYLNAGKQIWCSSEDDNELYLQCGVHDILIRSGISENEIIIDNSELKKSDSHLSIVVFDMLTEKEVDSFGINCETGGVYR